MEQLTIIGDYEVRAIDAGAGIVRYEATHVVLPRRAFIELLEPAAPRTTAVRLLRHACILEALRHPGVPRVFECGRLDGQPWVAFECCAGVSLETELRHRRLDVGEVLDLLQQVGAILSHAHARGVLHRDITPSAILRDPTSGNAMVLERWANACLHDGDRATPLRGSNSYRAPELIHNRPADGRADVFALGTITYQALSGREPLKPMLDDLPPALATLIARMIADDPVIRATAAEVVAAARAIRDEVIDDAERTEAAPYDDSLEVELEYAWAAAGADIEAVIDDVTQPVLLDRPRTKSRWTPAWGLDTNTEPRRAVDVVPRHRRPATEDAD